MAEIIVNQDTNGNYIISLSNKGKIIKDIAICFEEEYSIMIASSLAKNSNSKLIINIEDMEP